MVNLIPHLRQHFDPLQSRFNTFLQNGVQLEGWLKGEMLFLLDGLCDLEVVDDYDREVRFSESRRKVDLKIEIDGVGHWVELKYWFVGDQKGERFGPKFYFPDKSSVGIIKDVEKLRSVPYAEKRWMLAFNVANPGGKEWEEGLSRFHNSFDVRLTSKTRPGDWPPTYFIGLLEVA